MRKITRLLVPSLAVIMIAGCVGNEETNEKQLSDEITGEKVFQNSCIACHSSDTFQGGSYKLSSNKLQKDFKEKQTLYKFVIKNMPENEPNSLTVKEYEAVVDYLWELEK